MLAVCKTMGSAQKEQPLSRRASRATRRCNRSSRPAPLEPKRSLFCQRPLTRLLLHHPQPTHRSQSRGQLHRSRGRLRARCRPQGDADHQPRVRLNLEPALECSLLCQRPLTLLTTSHTPLLAVCEATGLVPREQPLSPRASRATRRCDRWSGLLGARPRAPSICLFVSAR